MKFKFRVDTMYLKKINFRFSPRRYIIFCKYFIVDGYVWSTDWKYLSIDFDLHFIGKTWRYRNQYVWDMSSYFSQYRYEMIKIAQRGTKISRSWIFLHFSIIFLFRSIRTIVEVITILIRSKLLIPVDIHLKFFNSNFLFWFSELMNISDHNFDFENYQYQFDDRKYTFETITALLNILRKLLYEIQSILWSSNDSIFLVRNRQIT